MIKILDIQDLQADRIFIFGNICGDYEKFIDILFYQNFSNKDIILTCGDFLHIDNDLSLQVLEFFRNNEFAYSVIGKNESQILNLLDNNNYSSAALWLKQLVDPYNIQQFLKNLPELIYIQNNVFIVNSGIEPFIEFEDQKEDVFYSIGNYDKNSRFYQFTNPQELSWYDFESPYKFIFVTPNTTSEEYLSGYSLWSDPEDRKLKCMIFKKNEFDPIIIEA
jgi:hypothetical protein